MNDHRAEDVPKNCWTCLHGGLDFSSGIGRCGKDGKSREWNQPCERYELNAIWLTVDWVWPEQEIRRLRSMKR